MSAPAVLTATIRDGGAVQNRTVVVITTAGGGKLTPLRTHGRSAAQPPPQCPRGRRRSGNRFGHRVRGAQHMMLAERERGLDERQVRERLRESCRAADPGVGSYSSLSSPTSLRRPAAARTAPRASSSRPCKARTSTSQNEQAQEDAFARRQPIHAYPGSGSEAGDRRRSARVGSPRPSRRTADRPPAGSRRSACSRMLASSSSDPYDCVNACLRSLQPHAEHLVLDLVTQLPPAIDRAVAPELVVDADGAIEGHPGHHLRVGEVRVTARALPRSRHLPRCQ